MLKAVLVILVLSPVLSAPVEDPPCEAQITLPGDAREQIWIGELLHNHDCRPDNEFVKLYSPDGQEDFEKYINDDVEKKVCIGFVSLVSYGEELNKWSKVCEGHPLVNLTNEVCLINY